MMLRFFVLSLVLACVCAQELIVTKEYTEYLKKHVSWEVVEYEDNIFRGWTREEYQTLLGDRTDFESSSDIPQVEADSESSLPPSLDWSDAECFHPIRNQGNCGSCWTFSVSGVVADRCCLRGKDHGWLAPQELVSCDKSCTGCHGGDRSVAMRYVAANGLVPEACIPYQAKDIPCPLKCKDSNDWAASHVCKCTHIVKCNGAAALKKCLTSGPVAAGMIVHADFHYYKSGVYHWDKKSKQTGLHAVRMVGYGSEPEAHWKVANSFGANWGMKGFFLIGVGEVGIDSRDPVICDPIA